MMRFVKKACFILCMASLSLMAPAVSYGQEEIGPGEACEDVSADEAVADSGDQPLLSTSMGIFRITGYCGCDSCSGGHELTYAGTVPQANHTVSADLDQFPLGTRLQINGIVYTVEDKGSSVHGEILDIYYDSHEDAISNGVFEAEVFLIEDAAIS